MKIRLMWACLASLTAFCTGVLVKPTHVAFLDQLRGKAIFENHFYSRMLKSHLRQDALNPDNSVFFLGDSHIQGLCTTGLGVNYGIGSDTTAGLLNRIPQYKSLKKASKIFVEIGCNDKVNDPETLYERIIQVARALPPGKEVIVCSLFPSSGEHKSGNRVKEEVGRLLATRQNGYKFMDIYRLLVNENNELSKEYDSGDGVHLNADGYKVFIEEIRKCL